MTDERLGVVLANEYGAIYIIPHPKEAAHAVIEGFGNIHLPHRAKESKDLLGDFGDAVRHGTGNDFNNSVIDLGLKYELFDQKKV